VAGLRGMCCAAQNVEQSSCGLWRLFGKVLLDWLIAFDGFEKFGSLVDNEGSLNLR
jgi:hypothetical protein